MQDLEAKSEHLKSAEAAVKRQRTTGDELGPILELYQRCDELRARAVRAEQTALDQKALAQHTVDCTENKYRQEAEMVGRSAHRCADNAAKQRARAEAAEAKLLNSTRPQWTLPPMELEYNVPTSSNVASRNNDDNYHYYEPANDDDD